jgi:hypothetical protein
VQGRLQRPFQQKPLRLPVLLGHEGEFFLELGIDYLCSKSTGAVTSCTLKYLARAGYFRATASYIA